VKWADLEDAAGSRAVLATCILARVKQPVSIGHPASTATIRRFGLANLRAAWWAARAARRCRRKLTKGGLDAALSLPSPPALPSEAARGVCAALRRRGHSCLMRSIVMQAWLAAHGDRRDLIVGVKPPGQDFEAHAWLEGESPHEDDYRELLRRPVS
jgi:hypothetical protein